MSASKSLAFDLLQRGDEISIAGGRLVINSKSGKPVPDEWFKEKSHDLICDILNKTNTEAFIYESYSTGQYGSKRYSGVTLQFTSLLSGNEAFAIFNADLKRLKTASKGKKGGPLPEGQFRVGKKSGFYKFWNQAGLNLPPRLSSFHDYMGNLKPLFFTGDYRKGEKLSNESLRPLNISYPVIKRAFMIGGIKDKALTNRIHDPDSSHTTLPDNELRERQVPQGVQPILTTGTSNYGTRLKGNADTRSKVMPVNTGKIPQEQTPDEWLADYTR